MNTAHVPSDAELLAAANKRYPGLVLTVSAGQATKLRWYASIDRDGKTFYLCARASEAKARRDLMEELLSTATDSPNV